MKTSQTLVRWLILPICVGVFVLGSECGGALPEKAAQFNITCRLPHYYMLQDFDSGRDSIVSPDRKSRVFLAKDFSFRLFREGIEVGTIPLSGEVYSNVQVIWAPDSEKFSITYSDGGEMGGFHVHIYKVSGSGITEFIKPPGIAFDDFKRKYYCAARGDNISALGWTSDSKMTFLMTEVYPTSDCGNIWGKEGGYLVDLSTATSFADTTTSKQGQLRRVVKKPVEYFYDDSFWAAK